MKAMLYKFIFLAILSPALAFCNGDFGGKFTKEKKISKEFKVSATSNLKIDNSYGNIDISTWDQNRVVIEVFIKTNGNNEQNVQEKLEDINVEFGQNSSGVSAKTLFSKENSSWWDNLFSGSSNVNMEINYVIRAPENNSVNLSNDYGAIYIDRLLGNANISCDYGRMDIGELRGSSNYLNFDYTRNSHIGYVKNAEINADYSDYLIEEAGSLKINADYTTSKIQKVVNAQFECDYGSMEIANVKKLAGNGDYLSTKIGRVFTSADINLDYGSLTIDKIVAGAKNVKVQSDYAGIKVGYARDQPFSFNINTSYGSVKGLDDFELEKQHQETTRKTYEGYHLSKDNGSHVQITTSYGSVSFNRK